MAENRLTHHEYESKWKIPVTMKNTISLMLIGALAAFLAGCAAVGPAYTDAKKVGSLTPRKGEGLIIIYAQYHGQDKIGVYGNAKLIATLKGGTFCTARALPGPVSLASGNDVHAGNLAGGAVIGGALLGPLGALGAFAPLLDEKKDWLTINVVPGQIYYFSLRRGFWRERFVQMSNSQAEEELEDCDWINPTSLQ